MREAKGRGGRGLDLTRLILFAQACGRSAELWRARARTEQADAPKTYVRPALHSINQRTERSGSNRDVCTSHRRSAGEVHTWPAQCGLNPTLPRGFDKIAQDEADQPRSNVGIKKEKRNVPHESGIGADTSILFLLLLLHLPSLLYYVFPSPFLSALTSFLEGILSF